jgi:hypothetical protein
MTNIYTQLAKLLNVAEITEDFRPNPDLQITEWNTADGYNISVMIEDPAHVLWDCDVYYYAPSFDDIINRIKDLNKNAIVYVSELDEYLPEYEVEKYLEQQKEKDNEKYTTK